MQYNLGLNTGSRPQYLNIGENVDFYRKNKPYPFDDKTFQEALKDIKSRAGASNVQLIQALLSNELGSYTSYELLCSALCNDEFELATALLESLIQNDSECFNRNKQELFEMSVCVGHTGIMKTLVEDYEVVLFQKSTFKLEDKCLSGIKDLLKADECDFITPFCIAAIHVNTQALELYLDWVSKDQSIDRTKLSTGLYLACYEGALVNVQLFIRSGLDFKLYNVLDYAAYSQEMSVFQELVQVATSSDLELAFGRCCSFIIGEDLGSSLHTKESYEMIHLILEKHQQCPASILIEYAHKAIKNDNFKLYDIILKHMEEHHKNDLATMVPLALKNNNTKYIYRCLEQAVISEQQAKTLVSDIMSTYNQIKAPSLVALLSNANVRQAFLNLNHPQIPSDYPKLLSLAALMGEVDVYKDILAKLESILDRNILILLLNRLIGQRFFKLDVLNLLLEDERVSLHENNITTVLNNVVKYDNAELFSKVIGRIKRLSTDQVTQVLMTMMRLDSIQCFKVIIDKLGKDVIEAHLNVFQPVFNKTVLDPSGSNVTKIFRSPSWLNFSIVNGSNQISSELLQNFPHESQESMEHKIDLIDSLLIYSDLLNKIQHTKNNEESYNKEEALLEMYETRLHKVRKCIFEVLKSSGQWQAFKDFVNGEKVGCFSINHNDKFKEQITELFYSIEQQRVDAYGMMQVLLGTSQYPNLDVMPEELIATLLMDYNELMASHIPMVTAELPLYKSFLKTRVEKPSLKRPLPNQQSEEDQLHTLHLKNQKGLQSDAMDIDEPEYEGDMAMEIEEKNDPDNSTHPFKHPGL